MNAHDDDELGIEDDLSASLEIIEEASPKGGKDRSGRHAPPGFNRAALFLLGLAPMNLFEPVNGGTTFRCKGCEELVPRSARDKHHAKHRRDSEKPLPQRPKPTTTDREEPQMAKDKDAAPKVSKTKIARETALRVLKHANKPMLMNDIVEKCLADAKVKEADIPAATLRAQVNFELAEKTPRIVRVDRGVYAHVDAADKKPPEKPEGAKRSSTRKSTTASSRKTTSTKKTSAASTKKTTAKSSTAARGDLGGPATPRPKPQSTKKTTGRSSARSTAAA